jgi:uncharacterized membrane protein YkvA (DUF1232 family)
MTNKRDMINSQNTGFFQDLVLRIKLIGRLLGDKRVNFFLKFLPIGAVIYLVLPVDLIPGIALPIIGALDDAAILWLGTSLFLSLCPDEVVQEHRAALHKVVDSSWRDAGKEGGADIVEVEPRDEE